MKSFIVLLLSFVILLGCTDKSSRRVNLSLNGEWKLAVTSGIDEFPGEYLSSVLVPGLVDLADPMPEGAEYSGRIYWHKRTFLTNTKEHEVCLLKINKAKYFTRIYINGRLAGENPYSFTPSEFDISEYLNGPGESNEIIISVGCWKDLPDTVTDGNDFEKDFYIPGIYDDVQITYCSYPYINNIQCVALPEMEKLRVRAEIRIRPEGNETPLQYTVKELHSGKKVASGNYTASGELADFEIDMQDCRLWSPEDPFLYQLILETPGDTRSVRFGMRSFRFDKDKKTAILNGKPYFMRGTNICIYRFFDDPVRKDLPWQKDWPVRLHEQFKSMHWNSMRYCIGFPPERWYEIADSLGFLIADEFPLWYGNNPETIDSLDKNLTADQLAREYTAWMRERWNHPSVVIWDAQNESCTDITGDAIQMVRQLDLSGRPWENGWAPPQEDTDPVESHPYLYTHYFGHINEPPIEGMLKYFYDTVRIPFNDPNERSPASDGSRYENPVIINEYCWLWMNRDGSPTRLTEPIYDNAFGTGIGSDEKFEIYARHTAIQTEYWRAYRTAAGVKHFCGLGYSRPDEPRGETCDNFTDIDNLIFEPQFEKYVRWSFSPVGLMLEVWDHSLPAGSDLQRDMYLINDLEQSWEGTVNIFFESDGMKHNTVPIEISAGPYESKKINFRIASPVQAGTYDLVAELEHEGEAVRSVRQIVIK